MFIADFHIHSRYSRATSRDCIPEVLDMWARRKGLDLIGTGDFTHQAWREQLKEKLVPSGPGLYTLKPDYRCHDNAAGSQSAPQFIVSGEISSIYKKNGKVRKVHNLIMLPGLEQAETIARRLEAIGNLHSDGRPILGLDSRDLLEIVLEACPEALFVPAHIWTPHFSLYGAYSGFDDINECFEDLTEYIYALETGLSSDPPMNWRLSALDRFAMISNSDAHSPANLAREANIFDTDLSYPSLVRALKNRTTNEFYGTIEFFPEQGKYHYDGHRTCKVCFKPAETKAAAGLCPGCGGRITVGVLHRVEALADRPEGFRPPGAKHFESLVPLAEVIAASLGFTVASAKVKAKYSSLIENLGPELFVLRQASVSDIKLAAGPCIAEGIRRLRGGNIDIHSGYDGEYGRVNILDKSEIDRLTGQLCFLNDIEPSAKSQSLSPEGGDKKYKPVKDGVEPALADSCLLNVDGVNTMKNDDVHIPYGLNQEQWQAVSAADRAIAVIAGPGTGKTKTLVSRIAYLVEQCAVQPAQITAVTFTNKAANEMRSRLDKQFGNKQTAKSMMIGTFHSLCLQFLNKWQGKDSITIIDEYSARSIIQEVVQESNFKISPQDAMRAVSLLKSGTPLPEEDDKLKLAILPEIYAAYCLRLEQYGVVDYDDILLKVLKPFESTSEASLPDNCFSYLLVDEFQDINQVQYRLIKAWAKNSKSLFIIGDPDQSIYGFRGSDFRYFDMFAEDFLPCRSVRLLQNYRSTPEIITCAKAVIANSKAGLSAFPLEAKRRSGAKVHVIEAQDEFAEAIFVAKEINRLVGGIDMLDTQALPIASSKRAVTGQPRGFADIAILYRTNRQARVLEQCLGREGIQYRVAGRDEFLADQEVCKTLAFFRFLLNPGDLISLRSYLKAAGSPVDMTKKILESYVISEKSIKSLADVMDAMGIGPHIPDKIGNFVELLKKYRPSIHREKPWKLIDCWIGDNNLSSLACMEMLLNTSALHNKMPDFLQNIVLGRESDIVRSGSRVYTPDAVSLMTMHGAKGLEFPVVFLCGVNAGLVPFKNSSFDIDPDEERRLFYVGMTRAQDELMLLTSPAPSHFLADMPEGPLVRAHAFGRRQLPQFKQSGLFD